MKNWVSRVATVTAMTFIMENALANTSQDLFEKAVSGDDFRSVADFAVASGISVYNFCSVLPVAKARNKDAWLTLAAASSVFLEAKGRSAKTCTVQNNTGDISIEEAESILGDRTRGRALWEKETYNIDLLKIETFVSPAGASTCSSGSEVVIRLDGQIGPDSSFAMSRLLERLPECENESGAVELPPTAVLHSAGGFLKDGYSLGRTLRSYGVKVHVEDQNICASSCAVAFSGGGAS